MKKLLILVFIFLISCSAIFIYAEGNPEPDLNIAKQSPELQNALKAKGIVILPEKYLRGYDPITVFYSSIIGPDKSGPLGNPGDLLSITPPIPGEFRFLDSKTIQFLPAISWPALKTFTIKAKSETKQLITLMTPPISISPSAGSKNLDQITSLTLVFPTEINPLELREMLSFEIKALPGIGIVETTRLTQKDFTVKLLENKYRLQNTSYLITFKKPIDFGKQLTLKLRLSLDESIQGSIAEYIFQTKQEFRLYAIGAAYTKLPVATNGSVFSLEQALDCGSGKAPIYLEFSDELGTVNMETVKSMLRFEPAVKNFRYEISGNRLYAYFDTERETPYQLKIYYKPLFSRTGRTLTSFGDISFYFYYRRLSSYIQWQRGQAIVERYGPKLFPMRGRALSEIDLRIYKIDPENRNYWPFPIEPVAIDEEARPPMSGEEPAYGTDLYAQLKMLGTPHVSQIVKLPIGPTSNESSFGLNLEEYLTKIAGPNAAGTYLVGYRLLASGSKRVYVRLTVTDLALTTIEEEQAITFAVTSLSSAKPLAGAKIVIEGERTKDKVWVPVISGITDNRGLFRYEHNKKIEEPIKRIIVLYGSDKLVFDPYSPPPVFANNHWWSAGNRWLSWINTEPRTERKNPVRRGYIYTERPVYRPDEPVHIMGFVRQRKQGIIQADEPNRERKIIVRGPGYKQWSYAITLQVNGSFYLKFSEKDLPTGEYRADLVDILDKKTLATVNFQMEAYRVPTFEVTLLGPDRVPLDRPFEIGLTATYYAGGRAVNQDIRWDITKYPYTIQPANLPGFIFSSSESFSGSRYTGSEGSIYQKGKTDENGSAKLVINPAAENISMPRIYMIEATVSGADTQTVTAVKKVIAVPSFAIGLKLERFLKDSMIIKPEIVIIDHNEKLLAGKKLTVRLLKREWHSYLSETDFTTGEVKYHTDVVDKPILERNYESLDKPLALSLAVDEAGIYVVEVLAKDNLGRLQKIQADLYVAGQTPVSWQKIYANIFETALDKKSYVPGETATLLLKSPFQNATALVILEGPTKNEYNWVEIKNGQGLFSFQVNQAMVPRVPVHALLMRGRIAIPKEAATNREDRGKPIALANTTWVSVETKRNELSVNLEHQIVNLPGKKMPLRIIVKDLYGKPVNGYASLWLVDRAVLALGKEVPLRPLSAFIDPLTSILKISETRNEVVGNLPVEEIEGGDDGALKSMREDFKKADLDDLFKRTTVRRNFQTVPYLNPLIPITNGQAEVIIELPENLTDFVVRAVVSSDMDKFGVASSVVSIRLPVIIQQSLPRFVRPTDEFIAGGIGRVVEGQGGAGSVAVWVDGLKIKENKNTDGFQFTWKQKIAQQLYFPFAVPKNLEANNNVKVKMAVERKADGATDGFEVSLPVKADTKVVQEEVILKVDANQPQVLCRPKLAQRPSTLKNTVVITYDPALIKLFSGLRYLIGYVHGCTEQRVSRLYPALVLRQALAKLGLAELYSVPDQLVAETFNYLDSSLTPQGLYATWPGSTGYVSLTAYVVEFLLEAKAAGYKVPEKLLQRPLQALKEALRSDYNYFISGYSFREKVEALVALAQAGQFDSQYAYDLLVGALNSDLYTQAKIASIFLNNKLGQEKKVKDLLELIRSKMIFRLKDNKEEFAGLQTTGMKWGGLILSTEVRTLAEVIRVLYIENPKNPRLNLMLAYLLDKADDSGWGSTIDNVAALKVLTTILSGSPRQTGSHTFEIQAGKFKNTLETKNKNILLFTWKSDEPATIKYLAGDKNNLPVIWSYIEYIPNTTGDNVEAENRGFVVEREILQYNAENKLISRHSVTAGVALTYFKETILEEHIKVTNSEDRNYVAIVVPFAAGLEPLNPNLATAPKEARPVGQLTLKPTYSIYSDDAVIFYYDYLPKGTYAFYYRTRASFEGTFVHPAAYAELMYDLRIFGRSAGTRLLISLKK